MSFGYSLADRRPLMELETLGLGDEEPGRHRMSKRMGT
jgi:hypothetical protein